MPDRYIVPEEAGTGCNRVLLIEKDPLQAHLLKVMIRKSGWIVCTAVSPREGLLCCEHDFFDAAVINSDYPDDVDGFTLAGLLRVKYGIPSLMITSARYAELKTQSGFRTEQELMFKPYQMLECRRRLQQLAPLGSQ